MRPDGTGVRTSSLCLPGGRGANDIKRLSGQCRNRRCPVPVPVPRAEREQHSGR